MNLICKFNFDDSAESKKNNLSKYDGIAKEIRLV